MTDNNSASPVDPQDLSGEQRLKKRRKRFWTLMAVGIGISAFAGFFSGAIANLTAEGTIAPWAIYLALAVAAIGLCWFSYMYYMDIDELDLKDNLWGNTFGYFAYIIAACSALILNDAGLIEPVGHLPILLFTLAVGVIAYLIRRFS